MRQWFSVVVTNGRRGDRGKHAAVGVAAGNEALVRERLGARRAARARAVDRVRLAADLDAEVQRDGRAEVTRVEARATVAEQRVGRALDHVLGEAGRLHLVHVEAFAELGVEAAPRGVLERERDRPLDPDLRPVVHAVVPVHAFLARALEAGEAHELDEVAPRGAEQDPHQRVFLGHEAQVFLRMHVLGRTHRGRAYFVRGLHRGEHVLAGREALHARGLPRVDPLAQHRDVGLGGAAALGVDGEPVDPEPLQVQEREAGFLKVLGLALLLEELDRESHVVDPEDGLDAVGLEHLVERAIAVAMRLDVGRTQSVEVDLSFGTFLGGEGDRSGEQKQGGAEAQAGSQHGRIGEGGRGRHALRSPDRESSPKPGNFWRRARGGARRQ